MESSNRVRARTRLGVTALLLSLLVAGAAQAAVIEGVRFSERQDRTGVAFRLQGAGLLRYRVVFKGYVAALYLADDASPERALDDVPRRLEIEYFWSIPGDLFAEAMVEGIARNVGPQTLARLRDPIRQMEALYQDVEPGDRYALTYLPGVGTELALNGERKGIVEGDEFSRALFAIWLGAEPLDRDLRTRLLGGES